MSEHRMNSDFAIPVKSKIEKYFVGEVNLISSEEAISRDFTLIDVRSPIEYQSGKIPNALNIPVFDNLERTEIGKIYKELGKEIAFQKGADFFEPKLDNFLLKFSKLKSKNIVVYCARGGMRSACLVRILSKNGFTVFQMFGGYKNYRRYVLEKLKSSTPPLIVLHGKTGVGKTLILQNLPSYIDLEGLAQHRSSLFGAINKIPNNQKNFESFLVQKLSEFNLEHPVFIEGESRKVGKVFIPDNIARGMKKGVFVLLSASMETRVNRIVEEYKIKDKATVIKIDRILQSLIISLGKSKIEKMRKWLKYGEIKKIVHMLLVDYYDPRYNNSMRNYKFELKISTENIDRATNELIDFRKELM